MALRRSLEGSRWVTRHKIKLRIVCGEWFDGMIVYSMRE